VNVFLQVQKKIKGKRAGTSLLKYEEITAMGGGTSDRGDRQNITTGFSTILLMCGSYAETPDLKKMGK